MQKRQVINIKKIIDLDNPKKRIYHESTQRITLHLVGLDYQILKKEDKLHFIYKSLVTLNSPLNVTKEIKKARITRLKLELEHRLFNLDSEISLFLINHFFATIQLTVCDEGKKIKEKNIVKGRKTELENDLLNFAIQSHQEEHNINNQFGYYFVINNQVTGYGYFYKGDNNQQNLIIIFVNKKDKTPKNLQALIKKRTEIQQIFLNQQEEKKQRFLKGPKL